MINRAAQRGLKDANQDRPVEPVPRSPESPDPPVHTRPSLSLWLACGLLVLSAAALEAKQTHLVIIAGIGGDQAHRERFHNWSMAMRDAAINRHGLDASCVFYLGENPEAAPEAIHAKSTKENIEALFSKLSTSAAPGDQIYVLLIGHGSYDNEDARFNLPGRDLSASDFEALLAPFQEQQVVLVNTSSASGAFLATLSKPNRILVTATKSGFERNEAQFGQYFVEAYSGDAADTDKNQRVSVEEAFEHARKRVAAFYEEENLLMTEHAQLEGGGEGKAGAAFLMGPTAVLGDVSPEKVASDPELGKLVASRQELEGRVEALKLQKESMPEDTYLQELERLLLELAAVTQKIEERSKS